MAELKKWQELLADKRNAVLLPEINEDKLLNAVGEFLTAEPEWLDNAIKNDAALRQKPDGTPISKEEAYTQLFTYQGLHAIALHRKAHEQYNQGEVAKARAFSQAARHLTGGIEIHPGAKIGKGFFVDHGAGVVIGETAEIGDNVFLYHTVTLGATGKPEHTVKDEKTAKIRRHPKLGNNITIANGAQILGAATIEDDVKIGSGARIIGNVTIGKGAVIGAGVEVQKDVPAGAYVVGMVPEIPGIIDKADGAKTPITRKSPDTKLNDVQWLGYLARGNQKLNNHAQTGALH